MYQRVYECVCVCVFVRQCICDCQYVLIRDKKRHSILIRVREKSNVGICFSIRYVSINAASQCQSASLVHRQTISGMFT